jgi:transposase-like protein
MSKKLVLTKEKAKGKMEKFAEFLQDSSKIEMIQMLIPLGLDAVNDMLQNEVNELAGERYKHDKNPIKRWGSNPGSVYLGDKKIPIDVPRVRNSDNNTELELNSYKELQESKTFDKNIYSRVINGISTGKYERAAEEIPGAFGIKKNSVSRSFIKSTSEKLKALTQRDLSQDDIVAIFIDGKCFADTDFIIALGVNIKGQKKILGFIESGTENQKVVKDFINGLMDRGLNVDNEILFIIDGAKGLQKGIKNALGQKAIIQRCLWHKRENIVSYLPKKEQARFRKKLGNAYKQKTDSAVRTELSKIEKELKLINESAVNSLHEGLDDTLTLHHLRLFDEIGTSFKTTNCIEALNKQLQIYTGRVCYWKNSNQKQRWVASALLEIEPNLRTVMGVKHLKLLREKMKEMNEIKNIISKKVA